MTSFGGLVIFQQLLQKLELPRLLKGCGAALDRKTSRFYQYGTIVQCLIVHLLLGYRRLRDIDCYREDPLVRQVLGLHRLPSVPTISRMLAEFDEQSIDKQREVNRQLVLGRLQQVKFRTITLDFDGSVLSASRRAEGTAVGFNKKKKGARSYYPLFCTVAQSGQVFDFLHRSGNVHDSNGATGFIKACVDRVRAAVPFARLEVRMDSAFFSDGVIQLLQDLHVEYTISVPFERFPELKSIIEGRRRWAPTPGLGSTNSHFERKWKPKSWSSRARFVFIRNQVKVQQKGPIQLDLFEPIEQQHEHKVIITNKRVGAGLVAKFHEGRGYQERIFGEIKSQLQMDYIPGKRRVANEVYLLCSVIAHNLGRELQMQVSPPARQTTAGRTVRWVFEELSTLRRNLIQRAGRITRPQGKLTLTLGSNPNVRAGILRFMAA